MAATKVKLPLTRARQLAEALAADLMPGCERIEIAGSVRRRKPEVGDLELVAVPKPRANLFGEPTHGTLLDPILERLCERGELTNLKGGEKYKQFAVAAPACCHLDLFLTTADQWGLILLIRTGPADFSKRFVTQRRLGGLLPDDLHVNGGRLWRGMVALPTPDERGLFELAGLTWVEPWERM